MGAEVIVVKLPAFRVRSEWRLLVAAALFLLVFAGSARPAPTGTLEAAAVSCQPGAAGHPGSCVDPIGDVKGVAGPDITRVMQYEWGAIAFTVTLAKVPPLTHSAAFTDEVSVTLTATGTTATKRYRLTVSALDPKHQILQRLPGGKRFTLPATGRGVSGKTVTLGLDLNPLVGNPYLVRYRVEAARVMADGAIASSDYVPNTGTQVWRAYSPQG